MTDIIAHYLTDKQTRYKDTHYRIYQVKPVDYSMMQVSVVEWSNFFEN